MKLEGCLMSAMVGWGLVEMGVIICISEGLEEHVDDFTLILIQELL